VFSRYLTWIEGQLSFRQHPPTLDWTQDQPVRMRAVVEPPGRVPVGRCSCRFLPVRVPVPPLIAKQADNRPVADRRLLRPLLRWRVPIARIRLSG